MTSVDRARQALGARLRELRKDARLNGREFSKAAGWHWSKTSRLERGERQPSEADIEVWCRVCDAELARPDLVAALRNVQAQWSEWKRVAAAGHARRQLRGVELDAHSSSVRIFSPVIISGLLQTEAYARAVLATCIKFLGTHDDLDAAVAARLARGRALNAGTTRFAVVIAESVLHTRVGDQKHVLADQLQHLLTVGFGNPRLILGVLPIAHKFVYTTTSFVLYDARMALVETLSAELTVSTPSELAYYEQAWRALYRQCVFGDEAQASIAAARERLGGDD
ncbi:helix-turn-helix domain-containing protein [Nocardia brasiliensis]|uniref:helix-turn-helix domain-containing protein n=1 Tax=Nocardia brasiliensis TaxID=37326 RepID=UPI002454B3F2|nr:helix-turn-helix transcriptional regulator [Nocardia brasiliensis]